MDAIADTAITPRLEGLREKLTSLLETARDTASERGWPVLASLTIGLPASLQAPVPETGNCFFWEQPSKRVRLAGIGAAVELAGEGDARFESLHDNVEAFFSTAVVEPTEAVPLALAGFTFDAAAWRDRTWVGFPDGLAVVPRMLHASRGGRHTLTLSHLVSGDDDVAQLAEALARDAEAWLSAEAPQAEVEAADAHAGPGIELHDEWDSYVLDLVERIGRGEAEKIVLARRVALRLERGFDVEAVLARLRVRYADCTLFAVRRGGATFIGATPEVLVSLSGADVRADCLAGTARRSADEAVDAALAEALLSDDKERREHALVVRGLRESLAPVCSALDVPPEPGLRRTATVQHLHTPVRATTDGRRHVLELVERLHPTPATAGLPRENSLGLIRQHEGFDRGWYAGPLGWLDANGDGEFAVALRSALIRDDTALLYAGCGIVAGSDPEREYIEAGAKLEAMRWALTS